MLNSSSHPSLSLSKPMLVSAGFHTTVDICYNVPRLEPFRDADRSREESCGWRKAVGIWRVPTRQSPLPLFPCLPLCASCSPPTVQRIKLALEENLPGSAPCQHTSLRRSMYGTTESYRVTQTRAALAIWHVSCTGLMVAEVCLKKKKKKPLKDPELLANSQFPKND